MAVRVRVPEAWGRSPPSRPPRSTSPVPRRVRVHRERSTYTFEMPPRRRHLLAASALLWASACGAGNAPEPTPLDPAADPIAAECPAGSSTPSLAGTTRPALQETATFSVLGYPWFTFDGESVYWVSYDNETAPTVKPTTVESYQLPLDAPTPRLLSHQVLSPGRTLIGRLWASGNDLAWLEFFPSKPPTSGALYTQPKTGGAAISVLGSIPISGVVPPSSSTRLLAVDEERLYLSRISPVGISAVARTTGETTVLSRSAPPRSIALEGDTIYWVEENALWRARRDGTSPQRLASGLSAADALAVHGGVAWLALDPFGAKRVARVAVQGRAVTCTVVTPAADAGRETQLLADASGLYLVLSDLSGDPADSVSWIRPDGGATWRLLGGGGETPLRVRLLANRAGGLLLATSSPQAAATWSIAHLPTTGIAAINAPAPK